MIKNNMVNKIRLFLLLLSFFIMACSRQPTQQAQGYVEGRYTYIATNVSGVLKQLFVRRGNLVKQGDLLFILDQQPEIDAYRAAVANLNQAVAARNTINANLAYAKVTYERYKILVAKNALQKAQLDNAKSIYDATIAQLAQANATIANVQATMAQAKWTLQQKMIYAPISGIVFDTYYRLGEYTDANHAIISLLAPSDIKAIFYLSEKVLGNIKLGDEVTLKCDGCVQSYKAHISFISPTAEYTPPVIYSNQTNEKLIYRLEADLPAEYAYQMHPGQPVTVLYSYHSY